MRRKDDDTVHLADLSEAERKEWKRAYYRAYHLATRPRPTRVKLTSQELKERARVCQAKYRAEHCEKVRESARKCMANPEAKERKRVRMKAYRQETYEADKAKRLAKWMLANPGKTKRPYVRRPKNVVTQPPPIDLATVYIPSTMRRR